MKKMEPPLAQYICQLQVTQNPTQTRLYNAGNLLAHIIEKSRVGFVSEV